MTLQGIMFPKVTIQDSFLPESKAAASLSPGEMRLAAAFLSENSEIMCKLHSKLNHFYELNLKI